MRNSKAVTLVVLCFALGVLVSAFYVAANDISSDVAVINDRDLAPAVLRELKSADRSIHIAMFSLTYYLEHPDSQVNRFLETLADKHDSGVDVRVVIDEFPSEHEPGMLYLKERGVPIKYDGKSQSLHAKLIIIDGKKVILGSTNWRYYSVEENHEANVLIKSSETAREFETYFEMIWDKN